MWVNFRSVQSGDSGPAASGPLFFSKQSLFVCFVRIDTSTGFVCRTQDQKFKKQCNDYRVRFSCPPEFCKGTAWARSTRAELSCFPPCSRDVSLFSAPPAVCWTKWYNRDSPSGTGDWEVLSNLRAENPGEICDNPTSIEAVTTDTLTPAISTGENFFA